MRKKWYLILGWMLVAGCTTDEPGKKECEIGTDDPDLQCVSGYECKCSPDGCFCEKINKLTVGPPKGRSLPEHRETVPEEKKHNMEYLKRLGLFPPDG